MVTIGLNKEPVSDVTYVEGVFRNERTMQYALYNHCRRYFDQNFRGVFFVDEDYKMDIFTESFIKLWENIESRKIYVEDGVLKGRDGMPFKSALTTYFMGIAKLKYKEWVRKQGLLIEEDEGRRQLALDVEMYKEILYGEGENTQLEIIADCISHMSERCREILTLFYYEEKNLDDIMLELKTFESKNALKTAKYKCMENLRRSAHEVYHRFLNS